MTLVQIGAASPEPRDSNWQEVLEALVLELENHGGFLPDHALREAQHKTGVGPLRIQSRLEAHLRGLERSEPFELTARQALRIRACENLLDAWIELALHGSVPRMSTFIRAVRRAPRLLVEPLMTRHSGWAVRVRTGEEAGPYACEICRADAARRTRQLTIDDFTEEEMEAA
jgi:hypothetical protein